MPLDRVTFVDSEENALDTAYTYDDPAVPFSAGRLTAITRDTQSIDYAYDRFGRTIQDGTLAYAYDTNGNRTAVTYPGGVAATTTHDYADREETLAVTDGATSTNLVTAAAYLPSGPLTSLALGNGLAETRSFDSRYFPSSIAVPGRLDWTYSTDTIGNILEIADTGGGGDRTYTYQDVHYFLTSGTGPWGALAFTYDKIGNRLSETRDAGGSPQNRPYAYPASPSGGNLPKLASITDPAGDRLERFFFDDAGNQTYRATHTAEAPAELRCPGTDEPDQDRLGRDRRGPRHPRLRRQELLEGGHSKPLPRPARHRHHQPHLQLRRASHAQGHQRGAGTGRSPRRGECHGRRLRPLLRRQTGRDPRQ